MSPPIASSAKTYSELRQRFLDTAAKNHATVSHHAHPLKGMQGEALFTDVAVLAKPGTKKWLVSVSGTHGVEGFYGSMCQTAYLEHLAQTGRDESIGILMVHLINPWGTSWQRRVNAGDVGQDQQVGKRETGDHQRNQHTPVVVGQANRAFVQMQPAQ